jgi:hypothetical protein
MTENQNAAGIPETIAVEPTPPDQPSAPKPPKPPSRLGRILRRVLVWAVGLEVIFALGVAAAWFAQILPKSSEIQQLRTDLAAAQTELQSLRPLVAENQTLTVDLAQAQRQQAVVEVLVDVTSAQAAMALENPSAARLALGSTDDRLQALSTLLDAPDAQERVSAMRARLTQILAELDRDAFAAQNDLEVLANDLAVLRQEAGGQ